MFFPARPLVNSSEGQAIPPEFFPSALKVLPFVHVWKVLMSTITFLPSLLFGTPSPCLCLETPVRTQLTSVPANPWPLPPLRPPRLFLAKYTPRLFQVPSNYTRVSTGRLSWAVPQLCARPCPD